MTSAATYTIATSIFEPCQAVELFLAISIVFNWSDIFFGNLEPVLSHFEPFSAVSWLPNLVLV